MNTWLWQWYANETSNANDSCSSSFYPTAAVACLFKFKLVKARWRGFFFGGWAIFFTCLMIIFMSLLPAFDRLRVEVSICSYYFDGCRLGKRIIDQSDAINITTMCALDLRWKASFAFVAFGGEFCVELSDDFRSVSTRCYINEVSTRC